MGPVGIQYTPLHWDMGLSRPLAAHLSTGVTGNSGDTDKTQTCTQQNEKQTEKIPCPKPASSQPKRLVQSSSKHSMCAPSFSFLSFSSGLELNTGKFLLKTSFQPNSQNFKKLSFKARRTDVFNLADFIGFFPFCGVQDHPRSVSVTADLWLCFWANNRFGRGVSPSSAFCDLI